MLRITIYTMLIVILTMGAASAQTNIEGSPGYTNSIRTDLEKKNDRRLRGARTQKKRTLIRGPMSGQLHHHRRPRTNNSG
jgi:hypothetical protein